MFRIPEVEITRPYHDASERICAHYLTETLIHAAHNRGGRLVYVDDNRMSGRRLIVWRFKFGNVEQAKLFDIEFD